VIGPAAALSVLMVRVARFDAPVRPDREQARAWARTELTRREYQAERPGPVTLLLDWIGKLLDRVSTPRSIDLGIGLPVAIMIVLALVGYVVWRTGGFRRQAKLRTGGVFDATDRTAADHRRAAEDAEAAGDLATALVERFRAIARALSDRALIADSPGLTADELARRGGSRLPTLADDFVSAARAFDDVRYGDRPATGAAVRTMADLDTRAAATTPVPVGAPTAGSLAVPR